jgi:hypothetical protein
MARLARWLIAGGAAALLLGALGGMTFRPAAVDAHAQALARWQRRPFADYRLVVQDEHCTYDVLVRGGRVNSSYRDSCRFQARSVDALFEVVERDGEVTPNCGTRGCLCETLTRVRATYHAQLGYPTEILVAVTIRPRWGSPDLWRLLLSTGSSPRCDATNQRTIAVLAVEPLPR